MIVSLICTTSVPYIIVPVIIVYVKIDYRDSSLAATHVKTIDTTIQYTNETNNYL